MIASDLCLKRRIRVKKKLKRVPKKEKEITYIFFYLSGVWILDLIIFLRPITFRGPAWLSCLRTPKAEPAWDSIGNLKTAKKVIRVRLRESNRYGLMMIMILQMYHGCFVLLTVLLLMKNIKRRVRGGCRVVYGKEVLY